MFRAPTTFRFKRIGPGRSPAAPYEEIFPPGDAGAVLARGWAVGGAPPVRLDAPIDWSFPGEGQRSYNFHLHSLDLIDALLAAHSAGVRDRGYLEAALAVAQDWARTHPDPAAAGQSPMAWYDMATGMRAYRLAYVFDEARRAELGGEEALAVIRASLEQHRRILADDSFFAAHSNHGFFQACGQMAMGRRLPDLPGMNQAWRQGAKRFADMVRSQFSAEGVHKEHSPGYHRAVIETVRSLAAAGFLAADLEPLVRRAFHQTGWFVKPDGVLANFGDTDEHAPPADQTQLAPEDVGRTFKAFPQSGYFVVRDGATYLAQTLAHHSRTHKQADDLSFIWCEGGRDLLVDAGRFGYRGRTKPGDALWEQGFWYSDPRRVYVESTHAHNTVEIDERSYDRRREKPYGSALRHAGRTEQGLYFSQGAVIHGGVNHLRLLVLEPGAWLLVVDRLAGGPGVRHTYRQWFHFATDLELSRAGDGIAACDPAKSLVAYAASLLPSVTPSEISRADESPRLQGWRSPAEGRMEPAAAVAFGGSGEGPVWFATVVQLGAEVEVGNSGVAPRRGRCQLRWSVAGEAMELDIALDAKRPPQIWRSERLRPKS